MGGNVWGNNSRDGYYYGYVDKYKRLMQFEDRDAYLEYISELDDVTEPYWKQQGSYSFASKGANNGSISCNRKV